MNIWSVPRCFAQAVNTQRIVIPRDFVAKYGRGQTTTYTYKDGQMNVEVQRRKSGCVLSISANALTFAVCTDTATSRWKEVAARTCDDKAVYYSLC